MELRIIKNKKEYEQYLDWVDKMFEKQVKPNTPDGEKLQVALLLIKQYEDKHYSIPVPDPIEAIKLKMKEKGVKSRDFADKIGSKGYLSAVLNKKKPLTMKMARVFYHELGISADVLLSK